MPFTVKRRFLLQLWKSRFPKLQESIAKSVYPAYLRVSFFLLLPLFVRTALEPPEREPAIFFLPSYHGYCSQQEIFNERKMSKPRGQPLPTRKQRSRCKVNKLCNTKEMNLHRKVKHLNHHMKTLLTALANRIRGRESEKNRKRKRLKGGRVMGEGDWWGWV